MASLLFWAASRTLLELLDDEKYLGILPGIIATLHTWGRTLVLHPHIHCLITGGGLTNDGKWKVVNNGYLIPIRVVMPVFRGKFIYAVRKALRDGKLTLPSGMRPQQLENLLNKLGRKKWNVHIRQRCPGGGRGSDIAGPIFPRSFALRGTTQPVAFWKLRTQAFVLLLWAGGLLTSFFFSRYFSQKTTGGFSVHGTDHTPMFLTAFINSL